MGLSLEGPVQELDPSGGTAQLLAGNILWQCLYQKRNDTSPKIDCQRSTHPAFKITTSSSNRKIAIFYPQQSLIAKLVSTNELGIFYARN
jgi:hypothetical protein